jgi:hypothetical protein
VDTTAILAKVYLQDKSGGKRILNDIESAQRDRVLQSASLDELMAAVGSGFNDQDPFDEYDEEPLYEPHETTMSDSDRHSTYTDGSDVSNTGVVVLGW